MGGVLVRAAEMLRGRWKAEWGDYPSNPEHFIRDAQQRLMGTGTPGYKRHVARAPVAPRAQLPRALELFKAGCEVAVAQSEGQPPVMVHRFYSGMGDALAHCPELEGIMEELQTDPGALLRSLLRLDKGLIRVRVDFKQDLTTTQKDERMACAREALQRINADPSFLDSMIWVDESRLWVSEVTDKTTHYYCDKEDPQAHAVHEVPGMGSPKLCLHFYLAVNAQHGVILVQFTTGTTPPIKRHHRNLTSLEEGDTYQVSKDLVLLGGTNPYMVC
jgi:hypothetical protein